MPLQFSQKLVAHQKQKESDPIPPVPWQPLQGSDPFFASAQVPPLPCTSPQEPWASPNLPSKHPKPTERSPSPSPSLLWSFPPAKCAIFPTFPCRDEPHSSCPKKSSRVGDSDRKAAPTEDPRSPTRGMSHRPEYKDCPDFYSSSGFPPKDGKRETSDGQTPYR